MLKTEKIEAMIKDCLNRKMRLSEWEQDFIDSIAMQFHHDRRKLSVKQLNRLQDIWETSN